MLVNFQIEVRADVQIGFRLEFIVDLSVDLGISITLGFSICSSFGFGIGLGSRNGHSGLFARLNIHHIIRIGLAVSHDVGTGLHGRRVYINRGVC